MNKYEIVLFIWLSLLTIGFSFMFFEMMDRTKKLKDTVTNVYSYINDKIINKYRYREDSYREDKKIGVGKWERFSDETCYWYGCSICHNKVPKSQYGIDYFSPYCPVCGAKMGLESEVEESEDKE